MNNEVGRSDPAVSVGSKGVRLVRMRLGLALLAAAIVPVALVAPLLVRAGQEIQARVEPAEASAVAARLSRELSAIVSGLTGLAVDADVLTAPRGEERATKDARADFARFLAGTGQTVAGVWLLDPAGGLVVGNGDDPPIDGAVAARAAVPLGIGEVARDSLLPGALRGSLGGDFLLATPVRSRTVDAPTRGVLLVRVASSALLAAAVAGLEPGAMIVGGDGSRIASTSSTNVRAADGPRVPVDAPGFDGWSVVVRPRPLGLEIPFSWFIVALVLGGAALGLVWWLARLVIRPARQLEAASERLGELYRTARTDALEDSLTGLGNHRAFMEEFDRQIDHARRYSVPVGLLIVDLDDFKLVNDSAGHAVGDELLIEMGRLLRGSLRRSDRPFRIGGDEFAILMPHTEASQAELVARRLLAGCVESRPGSGFPRPFSFSGGISSAPALGRTRTEVFAQADAALYRAKHSGRTSVAVYDPALARPLLDPQTLTELSAGVARVVAVGALRPVYQPIVDVRSGRVVGFEGLIRPDPASGFSDAGELFAAAEATGRTFELDRACLEAVARGAQVIGPDQSLSLNVSPRSLEAPEFSPNALLGLLRHHGLEPGRITLELTEREAVEDIDRLRHVLAACQSAGLRIAADDVGAGNAGLRLLSQIHFDIVKIDLSLVQEGEHRESSLAVLRALADLAQRWGAMVVAEGVETPGQLRVIQALEVTAAQGYLLGRPMEVPSLRQVDLAELLARDSLAGFGAALLGASAQVGL